MCVQAGTVGDETTFRRDGWDGREFVQEWVGMEWKLNGQCRWVAMDIRSVGTSLFSVPLQVSALETTSADFTHLLFTV